MEVEVRRSAKRRKTVSARLVDGVLRVDIPAWMSKADEQKWVDEMRRRVGRQERAKEVDLRARARHLATAYGLEEPASIRWVDNQSSRWGSCTPAERTVRISTRLSRVPGWVLDYVIVHELAHLTRPDHGPRFWKLVERYPRSERARGFLLGMAMLGEEPEDDVEVASPEPAPVPSADAPAPTPPSRPSRPAPPPRRQRGEGWAALPGFEPVEAEVTPPPGTAPRTR